MVRQIQMKSFQNTNIGLFYDRMLEMCCCCHRNNPTMSEQIKPKNATSHLCITDQKARLNLFLKMET